MTSRGSPFIILRALTPITDMRAISCYVSSDSSECRSASGAFQLCGVFGKQVQQSVIIMCDKCLGLWAAADIPNFIVRLLCAWSDWVHFAQCQSELWRGQMSPNPAASRGSPSSVLYRSDLSTLLSFFLLYILSCAGSHCFLMFQVFVNLIDDQQKMDGPGQKDKTTHCRGLLVPIHWASVIGKVRPLHRARISISCCTITQFTPFKRLFLFILISFFCMWHWGLQPKLHRTSYMLYNGNWIHLEFSVTTIFTIPCWRTGDMTFHLWPDVNPKRSSTVPTSWLRQVDMQFMQSLLQFSLTRCPFVLVEYVWLSLLHQ